MQRTQLQGQAPLQSEDEWCRRDMDALLDACAKVGSERGGVTAATVVLGLRADGQVLRSDRLVPIEHRYGVRITVLDEGSPTTAPALRITPAASATWVSHPPPRWRGALAWLERRARGVATTPG